jgi:uncharacterized membrane protein YdjX (TVP38/TMEM64 family)
LLEQWTQHLAHLLNQWGIWAIFLSLLITVVLNWLAFLPAMVVTGANVLVWGPILGGLLSWVGEVLGSASAFFLYRKGIQSIPRLSEKEWKWVKKFHQRTRQEQFWLAVIVRLIPMVPSGVVNLLGAFTQIYFFDFLLATAIGKMPVQFFEVLISHQLLSLGQEWFVLFLFAMIAFGLLLFVWQKRKLPTGQ